MVIPRVAGVTFDVFAGEVVTLLGRNGAGATTMKSIMGIIGARTGRCATRRRNWSGYERPYRAARDCAVPGGARILREPERAREADVAPEGASDGLAVDRIFDLFPVEERLSSQGTQLSGGGQRNACNWARPAHRRAALLLDEPTEGALARYHPADRQDDRLLSGKALRYCWSSRISFRVDHRGTATT